MKLIIFLISLLFLVKSSLGQHQKMFFIKDKDTLDVAQSGIKVFIEAGSQLIPFSHHVQLVYPELIDPDSINSILVLYNSDTLSFYNFRTKLQKTTLPASIIRAQLPAYPVLFADKRNMYFTVDKYPFENADRKKLATLSAMKSGESPQSMTIVELYYQVTEMQLYTDKERNKL